MGGDKRGRSGGREGERDGGRERRVYGYILAVVAGAAVHFGR